MCCYVENAALVAHATTHEANDTLLVLWTCALASYPHEFPHLPPAHLCLAFPPAAGNGSTHGATAGTAAMTELPQNGSTGTPDGSAFLAAAGSSIDGLPQSPSPSSELHSPDSTSGGVNPEKKKSSFKNIFKHRKPTAA